LAYHRLALDLAADLRQPTDRARAHDGLAHAYHTLTQHQQARAHWRHALDILTSFGTHHIDDDQAIASTIRTHLANLDQQREPLGGLDPDG